MGLGSRRDPRRAQQSVGQRSRGGDAGGSAASHATSPSAGTSSWSSGRGVPYEEQLLPVSFREHRADGEESGRAAFLFSPEYFQWDPSQHHVTPPPQVGVGTAHRQSSWKFSPLGDASDVQQEPIETSSAVVDAIIELRWPADGSASAAADGCISYVGGEKQVGSEGSEATATTITAGTASTTSTTTSSAAAGSVASSSKTKGGAGDFSNSANRLQGYNLTISNNNAWSATRTAVPTATNMSLFHPSGGWICRAASYSGSTASSTSTKKEQELNSGMTSGKNRPPPSAAGAGAGAGGLGLSYANHSSTGTATGHPINTSTTTTTTATTSTSSSNRRGLSRCISVSRSLTTTCPIVNDLTNTNVPMLGRVLSSFNDVQRRYGLSHVELVVQDHSLGRADMLLITEALRNYILYQGMELEICHYKLRVKEALFLVGVKERTPFGKEEGQAATVGVTGTSSTQASGAGGSGTAAQQGEEPPHASSPPSPTSGTVREEDGVCLVPVGCGIVTSRTIVNFNSLSPIHYIVIELSSEMWHTTVDGRVGLSWALKKFLREFLSEQLPAAHGSPLLRLVYTGRLRPFERNMNYCPNDNNASDSAGTSYADGGVASSTLPRDGSHSQQRRHGVSPTSSMFRWTTEDGEDGKGGEVLDVFHVEEISLRKAEEFLDAADQAVVNCDAFLRQLGNALAKEESAFRAMRNASGTRGESTQPFYPPSNQNSTVAFGGTSVGDTHHPENERIVDAARDDPEDEEVEEDGVTYDVDGRYFTSSQTSNTIECLAVVLEWCRQQNEDFHFFTTGLAITVISAGKGIYDVSNAVVQLVCTHLHDLGIEKVNVVCVGRPPLHVTPLLVYSTRDLTLITQSHLNTDPRYHSVRGDSDADRPMNFGTSPTDGGSRPLPRTSHRHEALYYESPEWMRVWFYYPRSVTNAGDVSFELLTRDEWFQRHHGNHSVDDDTMLTNAIGRRSPSSVSYFTTEGEGEPGAKKERLLGASEKGVLLPGLGIPLFPVPSVILPEECVDERAVRLLSTSSRCAPESAQSLMPRNWQRWGYAEEHGQRRGGVSSTHALASYLSLHISSKAGRTDAEGRDVLDNGEGASEDHEEEAWDALQSHFVFSRLHRAARLFSSHLGGKKKIELGIPEEKSERHEVKDGEILGSDDFIIDADAVRHHPHALLDCFDEGKEEENVELVVAEWFGIDPTVRSYPSSSISPMTELYGGGDPHGTPPSNSAEGSARKASHLKRTCANKFFPRDDVQRGYPEGAGLRHTSCGLHVLDSDLKGGQVLLQLSFNSKHRLAQDWRWDPLLLEKDEMWQALLSSIVGRDGQLAALYERQRRQQVRNGALRRRSSASHSPLGAVQAPLAAPSHDSTFSAAFQSSAVFCRQGSDISADGRTLYLATHHNKLEFSSREEIVFYFRPGVYSFCISHNNTAGAAAISSAGTNSSAQTSVPSTSISSGATTTWELNKTFCNAEEEQEGTASNAVHQSSTSTASGSSRARNRSGVFTGFRTPSATSSPVHLVADTDSFPVIIGNILLCNRALFGISLIDPFTGEEDVQGYRPSVLGHSLDVVSTATVFRRRWQYSHPFDACGSYVPLAQGKKASSHRHRHTSCPTDAGRHGDEVEPLYMQFRRNKRYFPHEPDSAGWRCLCSVRLLPLYGGKSTYTRACFTTRPPHQYNISSGGGGTCSAGDSQKRLTEYVLQRLEMRYQMVWESGGGDLVTGDKQDDAPLPPSMVTPTPNASIELTIGHQSHTIKVQETAQSIYITRLVHRGRYTVDASPSPILTYHYALWNFLSVRNAFSARKLEMRPLMELQDTIYWEDVDSWLQQRSDTQLIPIPECVSPDVHQTGAVLLPRLELLRYWGGSSSVAAETTSGGGSVSGDAMTALLDPLFPHSLRGCCGHRHAVWGLVDRVHRAFEQRLGVNTARTSKTSSTNNSATHSRPQSVSEVLQTCPPAEARVKVLCCSSVAGKCNVFDAKTGHCVAYNEHAFPRFTAVDVGLPLMSVCCSQTDDNPTGGTGTQDAAAQPQCFMLTLSWLSCSYRLVALLYHLLLSDAFPFKIVPFPAMYSARDRVDSSTSHTLGGFGEVDSRSTGGSATSHRQQRETLSHFVTCYYDFCLPALTSVCAAIDFQERLRKGISTTPLHRLLGTDSREGSQNTNVACCCEDPFPALLYYEDVENQRAGSRSAGGEESRDTNGGGGGCFVHCSGLGYVLLYSRGRIEEQIHERERWAAMLTRNPFDAANTSDASVQKALLPPLVVGEWRQNVPYAHGTAQQRRLLDAIRVLERKTGETVLMSVSNADYLSLAGKCLSVPERSALQCSIPLLASRYNAPAEFWGKILGIQNDYLIAQVSPKGFFGPRVSFYSIDGGNTWRMLEELTEDQAEYCDLLRGVYQGDPEYEYKMRKDIPPDPEPVVTLPDADELLEAAKKALENGEGDDAEEAEEEEAEEEEAEEEEEEEEEEAEEVRPKKKKPKFMIISLKEHFRISHFVSHHDRACRLTVRGEYILTGGATGEKNRAFGGQPIHNAMKPSCYLKASHWGKPERNQRLYGPTYNVHTDYLSPITDDMPFGVWTVKYDPSLNVVAVQNNFYDGSLFWYRPGTTQHGQVYFGYGERNYELCFTI